MPPLGSFHVEPCLLFHVEPGRSPIGELRAQSREMIGDHPRSDERTPGHPPRVSPLPSTPWGHPAELAPGVDTLRPDRDHLGRIDVQRQCHVGLETCSLKLAGRDAGFERSDPGP